VCSLDKIMGRASKLYQLDDRAPEQARIQVGLTLQLTRSAPHLVYDQKGRPIESALPALEAEVVPEQPVPETPGEPQKPSVDSQQVNT
jgi:hypothetical protein